MGSPALSRIFSSNKSTPANSKKGRYTSRPPKTKVGWRISADNFEFFLIPEKIEACPVVISRPYGPFNNDIYGTNLHVGTYLQKQLV
jgi:hypothetical protein